jgi:hypothetical protein
MLHVTHTLFIALFSLYLNFLISHIFRYRNRHLFYSFLYSLVIVGDYIIKSGERHISTLTPEARTFGALKARHRNIEVVTFSITVISEFRRVSISSDT